MNEKITLKIGANTNRTALETCIFEHLILNRVVQLDCIGERPTYIAIKSLCFVKKMFPNTYKLSVKPAIVLLDTKLGERKGTRLTVEAARL